MRRRVESDLEFWGMPFDFDLIYFPYVRFGSLTEFQEASREVAIEAWRLYLREWRRRVLGLCGVDVDVKVSREGDSVRARFIASGGVEGECVISEGLLSLRIRDLYYMLVSAFAERVGLLD